MDDNINLSHPTVRVTWVKQRADRAVLTFENVARKSVLYFDVIHDNFLESLANQADPEFTVVCIGKIDDVEQTRAEGKINAGENSAYADLCNSALIGDRLIPCVKNFLFLLAGDDDVVDVKERL